jgi:predicted nucleic acid-binding Zn ribbon protein
MGIGPRPVGSVLSRVVADLGLDDPAERTLFERWDAIAGTETAAVCRVIRFRDGRLMLGVDSPVWSYELSMRRLTIKERINAYFSALGEKTRVTEVTVKLNGIRGR